MSSKTRPHSSGNHAGTYADNVERPDVTFGGIGQPFAPMVATAPILSMSTPHRKVLCRGCTAKTWHQIGRELPSCAHCGGPLNEDDAEDFG